MSDPKGIVMLAIYYALVFGTPSIVEHDRKFARVYVQEAQALADILTKGDAGLRRELEVQLERSRTRLGER